MMRLSFSLMRSLVFATFSPASNRYETIDINLPVERPLTLAPIKETVYKDKPDMAELNLDDLERIGKLYNPYHIDRLVLRDRINKVLYDRQQTTLAEVIERNEGVGERSVGSVWIHWRAEGI